MAGRYVLTPARRAALKKAQAKSAAKRRGRGQYRAANKAAKKQIGKAYRSGEYGGTASKLITGNPQRRAEKAYQSAKNDNAAKFKGKKKLTAKQLKRRRVAKRVAAGALYVGVNVASRKLVERASESPAQKGARAGQKARKKQYKKDKKQSLAARKRNFKAAGLNKNGSTKRSRKPVKVKSTRAPRLAISAPKKKRKPSNRARR